MILPQLPADVFWMVEGTLVAAWDGAGLAGRGRVIFLGEF